MQEGPLAGRKCLDFVNTVDQRPNVGAVSGESLTEFADLLEWLRRAKLLSASESERILRSRNRSEAARLHEKALRLRETLYALLRAAVKGGLPGRVELDRLNLLLAALPTRILRRDGESLIWDWQDGLDPLARAQGELILDSAQLLSSEQRARIKVCAADQCGWLFLDSTKNGSRRWCDMGDCGNRAKAKRFYERSLGR